MTKKVVAIVLVVIASSLIGTECSRERTSKLRRFNAQYRFRHGRTRRERRARCDTLQQRQQFDAHLFCQLYQCYEHKRTANGDALKRGNGSKIKCNRSREA